MKTTKLLGLVAESRVKKADLNKLSGLIEPGRIVNTLDGSAYRVASKMVIANSFTFRLADLHGKPVRTPANFHPVSPAFARLATCMRFVFAFNKDFDLYVKSYIEEAGLPVDPKMNWSRWFQFTYPPKLSGLTKDPDVVDEAIHQVIFTALGKRKDLTKFDASRLPEGARKQPLAEQVTTYLQWLFKKRVSEAYEFIREKLQPYREVSIEQEGTDAAPGEEEGSYNILDTPEYATPGEQEEVGMGDLKDLRDQFAAYLQDEETPNEIKKLLVLYDWFSTHASTAHKLKISDYTAYWTEKTGLGFDSLKPVYAKFYGYMPEFLVSAGLISPEKAKARGMGAKASSLNLASAEVQLSDETTYVGDNEVVTAAGPTSDAEIIPNIKVPGPEAGPANDELYENSDALNGGSPTLDGDLKSPERPNINAIREAIDTQSEMEVGMPIAEKEKEVLAEKNTPLEVESGKGKQIIINIAKQAINKVAYVGKCPGHRNSEGDLAEWCVFKHDTGKILTSYGSEEAAKEGLRNMESHKHGATDPLCCGNYPECSCNPEEQYTALAKGIREGAVDLDVLKDMGFENPERLAEDILTGKIDQAVLADKLGPDFKAEDLVIPDLQRSRYAFDNPGSPNGDSDDINRAGDKEVDFNPKRAVDDTGRLPQNPPPPGNINGPANVPVETKPPEKPMPPMSRTVPAELPNREYRMMEKRGKNAKGCSPEMDFPKESADESPLPGEEIKTRILGAGESSPNGLSEEEAIQVLSQVQHGDRVTIMVPAGFGREGQEWSKATGRAVMRSYPHSDDHSWALNMGGVHGTPGVATTRNIVSVRKGKAGSKTVIAAKDPEVWKRLRQAFPGDSSISFSGKTQEYIVKHGYFYTHGYSEDKLEAAVRRVIPEAEITLATNHWNAWPKNSWFEVRFKVPSASKEDRAKAMGLPSAVPGAAGVDAQGNIIPAQEQEGYHGASVKKANDPLLETTENFDVAPDPLLESSPTLQNYGYAPSESKPQGDDTLRASNAEVLKRYDYTPFKDTEKAQYWKSPIGTTAILYPDGHWRSSAGDTVEGTRPEELNDRLLKYHHKVVPKMG